MYIHVHGTVWCVCVCVCVCAWCVFCWGIFSAFWSLAISGSLQSPPPYVNKHDRSLRLNQHRGGGGSQWVGAGRHRAQPGGVRVWPAGWLAGGRACACRRERESKRAWGCRRGRLALPCRLAAGEDRGKEEGSWQLGLLGDEAGRPNGGGQAASGLRWGDRSHGTVSTVRPHLMSGVPPTRAWGPLGRLEQRGLGLSHDPALSLFGGL